MLGQIALAIGLNFIFFLFVWSLILIKKNLALVDVFWGLSFLTAFWVDFYLDGIKHANIIMFILVSLWALRLSLHLAFRLIHKIEDSSYALFSKNWQDTFFARNSLSLVIIPRFIASCAVSTCLYIYLFSPSTGWSAPFWNVPLALLFFLGLVIESVADFQLYRFKRQPENQNKTCTLGLWRLMKHPNYIGEILVWISFGLLALPFTYGYLALISPLLMTYVLVRRIFRA